MWVLLTVGVAAQLTAVVGVLVGADVYDRLHFIGPGSIFGPAALALAVVLGVRLAQDYLVNPRVMGSAVGMSPLVVLFSASAVVFLFGGFAVLLAVPLAAVVVTLVDVAVRNKNPADEETPTVLFAAKEAER